MLRPSRGRYRLCKNQSKNGLGLSSQADVEEDDAAEIGRLRELQEREIREAAREFVDLRRANAKGDDLLVELREQQEMHRDFFRARHESEAASLRLGHQEKMDASIKTREEAYRKLAEEEAAEYQKHQQAGEVVAKKRESLEDRTAKAALKIQKEFRTRFSVEVLDAEVAREEAYRDRAAARLQAALRVRSARRILVAGACEDWEVDDAGGGGYSSD